MEVQDKPTLTPQQRVAYEKERGCTSKVAYPATSVAVQRAQEFMNTHGEIRQMAIYRCKFCRDWHLSKKISSDHNSPHYLIVDWIPMKSYEDITRARMARRFRANAERIRQAERRIFNRGERKVPKWK